MYSLKTTPQGYYESLDGITFYTISIAHSPSGRSWIVNRKLEELHSLYDSLTQKFPLVPEPPGYRYLSYISSYFSSIIPALDQFLTSLLSISSIYTAEEIFSFFDVGLHVRDYNSIKVSLKQEHKTRFAVKFLHEAPDYLITAEVDYATLHRLESYLKAIGYSGSTMSVVRCFGTFGMKEFRTTQVITFFNYSDEKSTIVLGFESGDLEMIHINLTGDELEFVSLRMINAHLSLVTGIVIEDQFVYSCGFDGRLIITSLNDANKFSEITLEFLPRGMKMTENMNYLYFCDEKQVFVFDVNSFKSVKSVVSELEAEISAFDVSSKGFVAVGACNGVIEVFSSEFELIRKFQVVCTVSCLAFNERLAMIAVSDANGIVHLCNGSGEVLFRWKTHDCTNFVIFDGSQCITAGEDMAVRLWRLENLDN